ncbi:MAG: HAD-IIB family hydrolase [Microlunatus sp.]|nr:HAD-IIB family hydrolase [Microlunatus sp.]
MPLPARLIAFDLDDTLAPSKSPLPPPIVDVLSRLLEHVPVAIISGGNIEQFRRQVVAYLTDAGDTALSRLHLMPVTGTQYYRYADGSWQQRYADNLTAEEKQRALAALEDKAREFGLWESHTWGPVLEDRGSQVTFSALGQGAPVDTKRAWDPTGAKKNKLAAAVQQLLPDLSVRSGGSTSVDITRKGIDKGYALIRLAEVSGVAIADMLFVGDRLDPEGNDYPVVRTGVATHAVAGWEETVDYLEALLAGV